MNNTQISDPRKKTRRHQAGRGGTAVSFAGAVLRGTVMALAAGLLLLLIAAAAAYSAPDPDALSRPLALAALYIGCFAGGVASMRALGSGSGYGAGAAAALIVNIVMFIVSAFRNGGADDSIWLILLLHAAVFAAFAAGAFAGRRRAARRRTHKRR